MNDVELEQVLKVTGINNIVGKTNSYRNNIILDSEITLQNIYECCFVRLYYPGLKCVCIEGVIPKNVEKIMMDKCPKTFYKNNLSNYKYTVSSKESLLLLILNLKDYYLVKEGKKPTEVVKYKDLITKVNNNLVKIANPNISGEKWVDNIGIYDDYIKGREKWTKTSIGRNFLDLIDEFDSTINILSNSELDDDKLNDLMLRGKIKVVPIVSNKVDSYENYCKVEIFSEDNKSHVCYERTAHGYDYFLVYINNASRMCFYHRYNFDEYDYKENEKIFCRHEVYGVEKRIEYSITNDKLESNKVLDAESFTTLYDQLVCATELAKEITNNRLLKKDKSLTKK